MKIDHLNADKKAKAGSPRQARPLRWRMSGSSARRAAASEPWQDARTDPDAEDEIARFVAACRGEARE